MGSIKRGAIVSIETRFDELWHEYKSQAKTARLIQPIACGNWLIAIESMPGVFLMIAGNATPNEVAAELAKRHVEAEAREVYLQRASATHVGSELMQ